MLASQIPTKFNIPFANAAGGGYINSPIPVASQIGITNGKASLTDGFPPLTFLPVGSGGTPPFGQDFNGILNQISAWSRWQCAGGPVAYDATFQTAVSGYPAGAIVQGTATGTSWLSLTDNNITNPNTGGAGWQPVSGFNGGLGTIASAATTDIGSVSSGVLTITGTTTITSLGTSMAIGTMKVLKFAAALTLTYNAGSLMLPTSANIVTAAGDTALVACLSSGNYQVLMYQTASGAPLSLGVNAVSNAQMAQAPAYTVKGNNTNATANIADLTTAQLRTMVGLVSRGGIFGLTLSNDGGTPATVLDIAAGEAASDVATPTLMVLGSAWTKSIASTFSAGSALGGLDTGTVAANSYHVFLIAKADGSAADVLLSLSATAPTMPATYTLKRRIGSIIYASATIQPFIQDGDIFRWNIASLVSDYSGGNRAKSALSVNVPSGIRVAALIDWTGFNSGGGGNVNFYDGQYNNISIVVVQGATGGINVSTTNIVEQFTNTSAQIQLAITGGGSWNLGTAGWRDTRGRQ